jgi:hypothetical protein
MAEEKDKETGTQPPDSQAPLSLGELRTLIADTVKGLVGTGQKAENEAHDKAEDHTERKFERKSDAADSIQGEVAKALQEIQTREAKQKEQSTLSQKVEEISKKVLEVQPIERRRIHKFMGWGEP